MNFEFISGASDFKAGESMSRGWSFENQGWGIEVQGSRSEIPPPVPAGAPIPFVVYANNEGPDDAANAQLTFTLPPEAAFDSLNAPAGWSCTPGQTVACSTAALPPGSAQFTIVATTDPALPPQTLAATASVSSTTSDPESGDNSADISVIITEDLDVAVTISDAPDPVVAGSDVAYTLAVTSNGPSAGDVTLTVTPPPALTQVSFTGTGWTCGSFTCTRTDMPPGTETLTLVAHVDPSTPAGPITTDAHLDASDSVPANNDDFETTDVVVTPSAELSVSIADAPDPVQPSSPVVYTVTATNAGPDTATASSIAFTPSPNLTIDSITPPPGWSCAANTCTNALFATR